MDCPGLEIAADTVANAMAQTLQNMRGHSTTA